MRKTLACLILCLGIPAQSAAPTLEALAASCAAEFGAPPHFKFEPVQPQEPALEPTVPSEPLLQDPKAAPIEETRVRGEIVGRFKLAAQLDRHRDLLTKPLGPKTWNISAAGDAGLKNYYLTFQLAGRLEIRPLGDLNRLRGKGIDVEIEPGVVYNFKVSVNIFNPARGSTLNITPVGATRGPRHDVKTGIILDAVKARSYVFNADGVEYWALYGTDVDPATGKLADTRTFLFVHEAGLSSKAWTLAEAQLPVGQSVQVDFGGNKYVLTRTVEGELLIRKP